MSFLKMLEYLELIGIPSMLHEFVSHKLAGSQKQVHTFAVGSQPAMDVSFRCQRRPCAQSRITLGAQRVPKFTAFARLACLTLRHQVVARTEQLEVIQVIHD